METPVVLRLSFCADRSVQNGTRTSAGRGVDELVVVYRLREKGGAGVMRGGAVSCSWRVRTATGAGACWGEEDVENRNE